MLAFTVVALLFGQIVAQDNNVWLSKIMQDLPSGKSIPENGKEILQRVMDFIKAFQEEHPDGVASEFPYFNFIPMHRVSAVPGAPVASWTGECFKQNNVTATDSGTGHIKLMFTSASPANANCQDDYLMMSVTGMQRLRIKKAGSMVVEWTPPEDVTEAEMWDLTTKGVRVMEVMTDEATSVANLLETVLMFIPEFTHEVGPIAARKNVDFMTRYPQFPMYERNPLNMSDPRHTLPPRAEMVNSGDFFGVIRLDGLDPMLAWAMGSTTGHTTIAMWIEGELYICESTVTDSYWPTNGIQKTPYKKWLEQAALAGYNVVHAPLNRATRAKFDVDAAIKFFTANEGFDYGYQSMLWGWIDTVKDNYPCIPSDYSSVCLSWELVEPLFGYLDRLAPALTDQFINQAFGLRLGKNGLRTAEIYMEADKQGIAAAEIPTLVEQDDFVYNTTRYGEPAEGKAMVCCVFVCNMWKAGGVFGDMEINCGEMTNVDDYSLKIFDGSEAAQIMGRWTLDLNRYNSQPPYEHMCETCASEAPDFYREETC